MKNIHRDHHDWEHAPGDPAQVDSTRQTVLFVAWLFTAAFLLAVPVAALWTGEGNAIRTLEAFLTILTSPCPLVTDYFRLGNLAAAFLNAGVCSLACALLMSLPESRIRSTTWAGYFLVIAHCFYGLNFINMWPPVMGFFVCCKTFHHRFRYNLSVAFFCTAFGPFISELLFRYPYQLDWFVTLGGLQLNLFGLLMALLLGLMLGFAVPATLPGAKLLHRGYNLYNGGLACGLLGLFIFAFMYKTMGVEPPASVTLSNPVYEAMGESYARFCNLFFVIVFGICIVKGWLMNGHSFKGYGKLCEDSGYQANFFQSYGDPLVLINLGVYGLMMVLYFDVVIAYTDGAGYTGATCGIVLAAMTFAASGQHPRNVWPIIAGYAVLSCGVTLWCSFIQRPIPWTLSTQGYMNGIAFATGLCPFAGKYGKPVGVLAGAICAVMCTTTSVMHGGFVLYNGGLTAGITALLLLPLLDMYMKKQES